MIHELFFQVHPKSGRGIQQPRARQGADRPPEDDLGAAQPVHQRAEREADVQRGDAAPVQANLLQSRILREVGRRSNDLAEVEEVGDLGSSLETKHLQPFDFT